MAKVQNSTSAARRPPTTLSFLGSLFVFWFFSDTRSTIIYIATLQQRDCRYPVEEVLSSFIFHPPSSIFHLPSCPRQLFCPIIPFSVNRHLLGFTILSPHTHSVLLRLSHCGTLLAVLRHPAHSLIPRPTTHVCRHWANRGPHHSLIAHSIACIHGYKHKPPNFSSSSSAGL